MSLPSVKVLLNIQQIPLREFVTERKNQISSKFGSLFCVDAAFVKFVALFCLFFLDHSPELEEVFAQLCAKIPLERKVPLIWPTIEGWPSLVIFSFSNNFLFLSRKSWKGSVWSGCHCEKASDEVAWGWKLGPGWKLGESWVKVGTWVGSTSFQQVSPNYRQVKT